MLSRTALVYLLLVLTGCASVLASKEKTIPFTSTPSGAEVLIDGKSYGPTPAKIRLQQGKDYQVAFRMDGHPDQTHVLRNSVGGGWVVLDVVCGLLPVAVDAGTGAWHALKASAVVADMDRGTVSELNWSGKDVGPAVVGRVKDLPDSGVATAPLVVTLTTGRTIEALRIAAKSRDTLRIDCTDGRTEYVYTSMVKSIVSLNEIDMTKRVVRGLETVPAEP